ncbi:MAG: hypothetical protein PUC77_06010 [Bacteroidales bacterium]|nr:hypothetical protein [Bacteroidales bacterium]
MQWDINDRWTILADASWTSWSWDGANRRYALGEVTAEVRYRFRTAYVRPRRRLLVRLQRQRIVIPISRHKERGCPIRQPLYCLWWLNRCFAYLFQIVVYEYRK